jgi:hypothetical protein
MPDTKATWSPRDLLASLTAIPAVVVGRLAAASAGVVMVEHDGNPRPARHVAGIEVETLTDPANVGREVLLAFERGDVGRPIVLAWMALPAERAIAIPPGTRLEARVDGERVTIEGKREILLRCGQSSILLHEDGRVVIRGTNLLSRSSGINKIKGGAVRIN